MPLAAETRVVLYCAGCEPTLAHVVCATEQPCPQCNLTTYVVRTESGGHFEVCAAAVHRLN